MVAAAAAHTAVAHARGEISNQRIIAAAVVAAVAAPGRIKAHVRGQMMTREQMMTRWMNVGEGGGDQRRIREGNCPPRGIGLRRHQLMLFWGGMHQHQQQSITLVGHE